MENVVILSYKRTPLGAFQGALSTMSASDLGGIAIRETIIPQVTPNEVYMGCVLQASVGQAPARQAVVKSGLSKNTPAVTINKVCGSAMQAIAFGCDSILSKRNNCIVAGGMESMSNAPYLLPKARNGYRIGHNKVLDHMFFDGLQDAYNDGKLMGEFAENTAERYGFSRIDQEEFAKNSVLKSLDALKNGYLQKECCKVEVKAKQKNIIIEQDEIPSTINLDKIPTLKPAFKENGTVTAASSSSISDGAAAVLISSENYAKSISVKPIAKIIAYTSFATDPEWFTVAPIEAIKKVLKISNWDIDCVDLFEINEAFAVVTMSAIKELKLDPAKVNIFGGACALGHPIGASGARILVTLINSLKIFNKKRGLATLCVGGGEAIAMTIEIID